MKTTTLALALMTASAVVGCGDSHPLGEGTGMICVIGFDLEYDTSVTMLANGELELPIGQIRERPAPLFTIGGGGYGGWSCDPDGYPDLVTAEVVSDGGEIDAQVVDGTLRLKTTGPAQGTLRLISADHTLSLPLHVHELAKTRLHPTNGGAPIMRVASGSMVTFEVTHEAGLEPGDSINASGRDLGGEFLEWPAAEAWTSAEHELRLMEFHSGPIGDWNQLRHVRVTDTIGTHRFDVPGELDGHTHSFEVVDVDSIDRVRLCNIDQCVGDGDAIPGSFFWEWHDSYELEFRVEFVDADGEVVYGRPDDFTVKYGGPWVDVRTSYERRNHAEWSLESKDEAAQAGWIEVDGHGRTARVTIDPALAP